VVVVELVTVMSRLPDVLVMTGIQEIVLGGGIITVSEIFSNIVTVTVSPNSSHSRDNQSIQCPHISDPDS
jgi:hypothetical protein